MKKQKQNNPPPKKQMICCFFCFLLLLLFFFLGGGLFSFCFFICFYFQHMFVSRNYLANVSVAFPSTVLKKSYGAFYYSLIRPRGRPKPTWGKAVEEHKH